MCAGEFGSGGECGGERGGQFAEHGNGTGRRDDDFEFRAGDGERGRPGAGEQHGVGGGERAAVHGFAAVVERDPGVGGGEQ